MAQFWLGIYNLAQKQVASGRAAEPILFSDVQSLAVEVIRDGKSFAVLFSRADGTLPPAALECRIAFANNAALCNTWRDRGFPLVDATIELDAKGKLTVLTPFFAGAGSMEYESLLVSMEGVDFTGTGASQATLAPCYDQRELGPDAARPATEVQAKAVEWQPQRQAVRDCASAQLVMTVTDTRSPSLVPFKTSTYPMVDAWTGTIVLPRCPVKIDPRPVVSSRLDTFGVPAFVFGDVEVMGFRIELPRHPATGQALRQLLATLNFHLTERDPALIPDFRYQPVSYTLLVELLRYGTMRLATQQDPLTQKDFQSQHELVVRILVGRVDDDSAQARDPAVFVPAIFVDNPWSKILGRDMQGFPKELAQFSVCTQGTLRPLRPDGLPSRIAPLPGIAGAQAQTQPQAPVPGPGQPGQPPPRERLVDVCRVSLAPISGSVAADADTLLEIERDPACVVPDDFDPIGAGEALSQFSLADARWRPYELSEVGNLGSFLLSGLGQVFHGFRSVQAAPVSTEKELDQAWITGRFTIGDIAGFKFPLAPVRLTFRQPAAATAGWKDVCALLSARPWYDFHFGQWYRLKFSMRLAVDDGLAWAS